MAHARVLIAGIGNIFLGDDGFGVEVAQRLAQRRLPEDACVVDFGIRGIDLSYALLEDYETVILVDAVPRGENPGELCVIEPEAGAGPAGDAPNLLIQPHNLDPAQVLRLAAARGSPVKRFLLVGCQPMPLDSDVEMRMGLSEPVAQAVDKAVALIEGLVDELLQTEGCNHVSTV